MAQTELEKTLKRMKISLKAVELVATPACGFAPSSRPWRCTISRETGGDKPLRLTITVLSGTEPTLDIVIKCLVTDVETCELSLWDFAQEHNDGNTDKPTERMYKSCKRVGSRVKRLFGDSWPKIVNKAA
jgi:hypothetical protein